MKTILLIILLVIVTAISALFFAQNDALVEIKYFGGTVNWQMNWVIITIFMLGVVVGVGTLVVSLLSTKLKLVNANRRLKLQEKEIQNLRALPIKDEY